MDPGEPDDTRARADGAAQPLHHLLHRSLGGCIIERNPASASTVALAGKTDRLVVHVVLVGRGEDFVAGLERESVVDEGKALRCAVCERHLIRPPAEIICRSALHPGWKTLRMCLLRKE